MNIDDEVKRAKEEFVSGHNGTHIHELTAVVALLPVAFLARSAIASAIRRHASANGSSATAAGNQPSSYASVLSFLGWFALDVLVTVVPMIAACTLAELLPGLYLALAGIAFVARRSLRGAGAAAGVAASGDDAGRGGNSGRSWSDRALSSSASASPSSSSSSSLVMIVDAPLLRIAPVSPSVTGSGGGDGGGGGGDASIESAAAPVPSSKPKFLFVSRFRTGLLLLTAISILAVDFHIYPRRFTKTETFGTGLMDIGVGSFIFADAIVVAASSAAAASATAASAASVSAAAAAGVAAAAAAVVAGAAAASRGGGRKTDRQGLSGKNEDAEEGEDSGSSSFWKTLMQGPQMSYTPCAAAAPFWCGVVLPLRGAIVALLARVLRVLRRVVPLLLLGVYRFLGNRSVNYQEHASEYGLHWNFFFTLAGVAVLSDLALALAEYALPASASASSSSAASASSSAAAAAAAAAATAATTATAATAAAAATTTTTTTAAAAQTRKKKSNAQRMKKTTKTEENADEDESEKDAFAEGKGDAALPVDTLSPPPSAQEEEEQQQQQQLQQFRKQPQAQQQPQPTALLVCGCAVLLLQQLLLSSPALWSALAWLCGGSGGGGGGGGEAGGEADAGSRSGISTGTDWVLRAPRHISFWHANKEGVASLPGYLALYLLSQWVGHKFIALTQQQQQQRQQQPPQQRQQQQQPSKESEVTTKKAGSEKKEGEGFFDDEKKVQGSSRTRRLTTTTTTTPKPQRVVPSLLALSFALWLLAHLADAYVQRISRRLCNAPFVLWMLALNTSLLLLCLLVETLEEKRFTDPCKIDAAAAAPAAAAAAVPADSAFERLGALLWAIDRSQLLFFVLANLCTGIVNVAVNTMLVADRTAFAILVLYISGATLLTHTVKQAFVSCKQRKSRAPVSQQ